MSVIGDAIFLATLLLVSGACVALTLLAVAMLEGRRIERAVPAIHARTKWPMLTVALGCLLIGWGLMVLVPGVPQRTLLWVCALMVPASYCVVSRAHASMPTRAVKRPDIASRAAHPSRHAA